MRDYIIAFREADAAAMAADWYLAHKRISDAIGEVRRAEGRRPWQFSCDPRAVLAGRGTRFVAVRCEGAPSVVMAPLAVAESPVEVPALGARVAFAVHFSSKLTTRCDMASLRVEAAARGGDLRREGALSVLASAGLADVRLDAVAENLFPVRKGRSRTVPKYATSAMGSATVSDSDALSRALWEGVGRDRGFGFGMLFVEAES